MRMELLFSIQPVDQGTQLRQIMQNKVHIGGQLGGIGKHVRNHHAAAMGGAKAHQPVAAVLNADAVFGRKMQLFRCFLP